MAGFYMRATLTLNGLTRNADQFTIAVSPFLSIKGPLLRLENHCENSRFFPRGQLYRLGDTKRNVSVVTEFRISVHHK